MALLFLAPPAPRAEGDVGPMRLGLPGLWDTMVGPELGGAPLRLGIYGEHGTIDDGHGFTGPGILPPVTTQQLRAHLGFRLSHGVILGASLPYRRYDIPSSDTVPAVSAAGVGDFEASVSLHLFSFSGGNWRSGLWGVVRMPTGDLDKGLSTNKTEGEYGLHSTFVLFRKSTVPETRITLNVGYRYNNNELNGYGNLTPDYSSPDSTGVFPPLYPALAGDDLARDNNHLLLRGGVEFRRKWAHIFVEWSADYLAWYDDAKYSESASWITPGVYLGAEGGLALKAAWSIGLWADDASTAYTPRLPDWIFSAGLSMPLFLGGRDRDQDGIRRQERCMSRDSRGHRRLPGRGRLPGPRQRWRRHRGSLRPRAEPGRGLRRVRGPRRSSGPRQRRRRHSRHRGCLSQPAGGLRRLPGRGRLPRRGPDTDGDGIADKRRRLSRRMPRTSTASRTTTAAPIPTTIWMASTTRTTVSDEPEDYDGTGTTTAVPTERNDTKSGYRVLTSQRSSALAASHYAEQPVDAERTQALDLGVHAPRWRGSDGRTCRWCLAGRHRGPRRVCVRAG